MTDKVEMVSIPKARLVALCDREEFLLALESAGVDNWDGYGYAQEIIEKWREEDS